MVKASDSEYPSVLFDDQSSTPTTPASGFSRVFTKSDGLYVVDDGGGVTGPMIDTGGGASIGPYAIVSYTGGDITLGSGTSPVVLPGPGDCVVAASTGDLLLVGLNARTTDTDADSLSMDAASIVAASPVNYLSSGNGTPLTTGIPGWYFGVSRVEAAGATFPYVVQAGDISGGNVTLRLYYRVSGTGKVLAASSTIPLTFWVKNLLQ